MVDPTNIRRIFRQFQIIRHLFIEYFDTFIATEMQIFERIKKARERSGLTPEALAAKLGIPRTTYLYWEESTPKPEKVMSVAKALGLPEYYFFIPGDDEKDGILDKNTVEYSDNKLEEETSFPIVNEPAEGYLINKNTSVDYLAGRLAEKDATIEQTEKRINEALSFAHRMEAHYKDMKDALERAQTTINEVLKPIKEQTAEILTSSKKAQEALQSLKTEVVAEHGEMMETLDQIAGNEPGTTAAKAGTLELAHRAQLQKGKKASTGKQG